MNEEGKEAIEILESFEPDDLIECAMYRNALDKVLNLINKQDREIEHQKEKRENQKNELAILNEKQKEFNKMLNTIKSYKGQFKRQEREIDKQNKVIDEMSRIIMLSFQDLNSIEEVKQYFTRKVEENEQS